MSKQKEEVNWAKVTLMNEALNEYNEEKLEKGRVFNPKDIVEKAGQSHEIYDEKLGVIRYVYLSYIDLHEMDKFLDNPHERSVQILFKQLSPNYPELTLDDLRKMPYEVVVRLLVKLQGEGSFFYRKPAAAPKNLKNGSASTSVPKTSG